MVTKLGEQTIVCKFDFHWVVNASGLVLNKAKISKWRRHQMECNDL